MPRKADFKLGQNDKHNVEYSYGDDGRAIHVTATTYPSNPTDEIIESSGAFEYDPTSKQHVPVPGTLDLHPAHAAQGVGQEMRRRAETASAK
jgi:hypothetical protein